MARGRTHTLSAQPLVDLIDLHFPPQARIEDLALPFVTVATSIERAAEQSFDAGPLVPAVLASASVPGLLPPTVVAGEHYLDGGLVASRCPSARQYGAGPPRSTSSRPASSIGS